MKLFMTLKERARNLKRDVGALYLAYKRPDVPIFAKILAILVVGYALSPVDLVPDFIPVLGYLDDLILIPLGIWLVVKYIPPRVMEECREQSEELFKKGKPQNYIAMVIILAIWAVVLGIIILNAYDFVKSITNGR